MGLTPIASLSPFEHPNGESGDSRLPAAIQECRRRHPSRRSTRCRHARPYFFGLAAAPRLGRRTALTVRSEEHTSELQSLMRISYAVFCFKEITTLTSDIDIVNTTTTQS